MLKRIKLWLLGILILVSSNLAYSQWPIMRNDADSLLLLGTDYIYNMEFEKAYNCFKQMIIQYPDHPAGYCLDAMLEWWKISLYRNTTEYDNNFLSKVDRAIKVCDKLLDANPVDIKALFFKGGVIGYRGRFYAAKQDWIHTASDGNTALNILIECLKNAPQNYDIMLGTGLYNYFAAVLPDEYPLLKPFMLFLPSGNKQIGLAQLQAAARNARYASVEAKVVLLNIYFSFEKNYTEAQKLAEELFSKYPNNPYFHRYLGRCYVINYNIDKWDKTWRQILLNYMDKKPGYDALTARDALYYIGTVLFYKQNYNLALKYFNKCEEASRFVDKETTGFMVKTHIKLGNVYDKLGKRNQAIKEYQAVLEMKEIDTSHDEAKTFLKTPF